ncbi:MAG TPA: extracellular solute-binding protein, partial [Thermotogota bacterium]|nr:extracellular solute-binding protein [Thermotogota bacterium]
MSRKSKVLLFVVLAMFFLVSLVGAKMTITWWINPWRIAPPGFPADQAAGSEDFPKWISEEFMKLHPDVEVKYVVVGNTEYSQKMAAAIATRTQPDLFKGPIWDSRWVEAGLLEPIDDYLTEEDWEDFYEIALDDFEVNGKHYVFPWSFGTNGMGTSMLLYTPDFEKAGVDWRK